MSELRNMKRRIGQRVIFGFEGTTVPAELARLHEEWGIGGYILFKRNLQNLEQVMDLNEKLWALGAHSVPPFIGVDAEGGKVHRLPEGFTTFAEMQMLGQLGSVSIAYEVGAVIGRELSASGFNLNFAPVLDLNTNPDNPIIASRAISADPEVVSNLGKALIRGLHDNAIIACGKHFPGHGDTTKDSHLVLPTCDLDLDKLRARELKPYQRLINQPGEQGLDMIMGAHVVYPKVDEAPASISRTWLQDILRLELGYRGLIVTDDLEMKAIVDNYSMEEVTVTALEAGVDLFMVCHSLDKQVEVLETLLRQAEGSSYPKFLWEKQYKRVYEVKKKHFHVVRSLDRTHAKELVGNREHVRISRRLKEGK